MRDQRYNDSSVFYLIILIIELNMITQRPWRKLWGRKNFVLSKIERKKAWPTGRLRKIIISLNKRRRILCLTIIFKNNKAKNYSNNKNFQGNRNSTPNNRNNFKGKETANNHGNFTNNFERKEPVKCWECNGPHYASVCPNWKNTVSNIHTI